MIAAQRGDSLAKESAVLMRPTTAGVKKQQD